MNHGPLKGFELTLITIALGLAAFMQILDTSIANVAVPYISGNLGVSATIGSWVITMFAVGNAIALPLTGWFAERFGQVRIMVLSIVLFTILSWVCAASFSFNMLVFSRFFQGFVAGPLLPLSQSIIMTCYPLEKRNLASALFYLVIVVAPIFGPLLGGWLTYNYSWPWIFYINLPVGIFSALLTWKILKKRESEKIKRPPDYWGFFLLFIGVGLLQVMLDKGEQYDWFSSPLIQTLAVISGIALIFLVIRQLSIDHPAVEFRFFKIRTFRRGTIMTALNYMMIFSAIVITPLWLQEYMGYTAVWAGIAVAPMGILPVILSVSIAKIMNKVRAEFIILSFHITLATCFFFYAYTTPQIDVFHIGLSRLLLGLALVQFLPPLYSFTTREISNEQLPSATGVYHFIRIFSGGAGTSLAIYLWDRRAIFHHERIGEWLTLFSSNTKEALKTISAYGISPEASLELLNNELTMQAYILATNDLFGLFAIISLILAPLIFISYKKNSPPSMKRAAMSAAE